MLESIASELPKPAIGVIPNIRSLNERVGWNMGLSLQERKEPTKDETIAVIIWKDGDNSSIMYDPWCSNKMAQVQHGHYHTSWAANILEALVDIDENEPDFNKRISLRKPFKFQKPATFDWTGKTVYIVGRGASCEKNLKVLNSVRRENPAIFLNTAYNSGEVQNCDYVLIADNRILGLTDYKGAIDAPLITFPGVDAQIIDDKWTELYGFVPWTKSPLNMIMQKAFPHLPKVLDILCCSVMASHLACLNGAKNIVYLGMDNTHLDKKHKQSIKTKDIFGINTRTIRTYGEMAVAAAQFCGFARFHCKTRFINATGSGILGVNPFEGHTLFPWIQQMTMEEAIEECE